MRRLALLCVFALISANVAGADGASTKSGPKAPPRYRWEHAPDESVTLIGPCGVVWRLNLGAQVTKPHFHPLQTAGGRCLTQVSPADHRWHYGLWHSWKYIDGVNYWEEDQPGGRPAGVTCVVAYEVLQLDNSGARFRLRLEYAPAIKPDQVALEDTIDLWIEMPREDGSYRLDWTQTSRARRQLRLDRTPIPGEPEGKDYGGYAGLSFRGDRFLTNVSAQTSTGAAGLAAQRKPARWAALSGLVDGAPVSLALFDHPGNARHPTPWYFVLRPGRGGTPYSPFWYVNAAFLNDAAFDLAPDRPLTRRYRIRVADETALVDTLDPEYSQLAAGATMPGADSR